MRSIVLPPLAMVLSLAAAATNCKPPCNSSGDCESSEICSRGVCTRVCRGDSECEVGLECRDRECVAPELPVERPDAGPRRSYVTLELRNWELDERSGVFVDVPAVDVEVVFHDVTGEPVSTGFTSANGIIVGDIDEGMMSILGGEGRIQNHYHVFAGLRRGMRLVLGRIPDQRRRNFVEAAVVARPGSFPGASFVQILTGCTLGWGMDYAGFAEQCADPSFRGTALALAAPDERSSALAFSFLADIPLDVPRLEIFFPPWRTDWRVETLTFTGLPAGTVYARAGLIDLREGAQARFNYRGFDDFEATLDGAGSGTLSVRVIPGLAKQYRRQAGVSWVDSAGFSQFGGIEETLEIADAGRPIDVARDFLPKLTDLTLSNGPVQIARWSFAQALPASVDVVNVRIGYAGRSLTLHVPPERRELYLPRYPATLRSPTPRVAETKYDLTVRAFDEDQIAGYEDAIPNFIGLSGWYSTRMRSRNSEGSLVPPGG